jgi:hypothetical protein
MDLGFGPGEGAGGSVVARDEGIDGCRVSINMTIFRPFRASKSAAGALAGPLP